MKKVLLASLLIPASLLFTTAFAWETATTQSSGKFYCVTIPNVTGEKPQWLSANLLNAFLDSRTPKYTANASHCCNGYDPIWGSTITPDSLHSEYTGKAGC